MAITRICQLCAEYQDYSLEFSSRTSTAFAHSNTQAKTGTYSYRYSSTGGATRVLPASYSQFRFGWHLNHAGPSSGDNPALITFGNSADDDHIQLRFDGATLSLYVAGTMVASASVASLAQTLTWLHAGVDVKLAVAGWVYVYVDGLEVLAYDGNTAAQPSIDRFTFGYQITGQTWANYVYVDDIFFDNTNGEATPAAVPDRRFFLQTVDAVGSVSDLTGSDGNSVDNHLLVDDIPHDSDTTYVEAAATDLRDLYSVTPFTLPADYEIRAVIPWAIARKSDAEVATQLELVSKNGANETVSAAKDLATSYGLLQDRQTAAPGGATWSESAVNASEYGVESAGTF